jgi:hypothetical protein
MAAVEFDLPGICVGKFTMVLCPEAMPEEMVETCVPEHLSCEFRSSGIFANPNRGNER